jgi:hypothetical protein
MNTYLLMCIAWTLWSIIEYYNDIKELDVMILIIGVINFILFPLIFLIRFLGMLNKHLISS